MLVQDIEPVSLISGIYCPDSGPSQVVTVRRQDDGRIEIVVDGALASVCSSTTFCLYTKVDLAQLSTQVGHA